MMSPWKRQKWREKWTRNVRREEEEKKWRMRIQLRGRGEVWVHISRAWAKALLIMLVLSVTTSEDTVGLWCMAASSYAAPARATSQGVRHHRDSVFHCRYGRGRAPLRAPYITTPLRLGWCEPERCIRRLDDLWEHGFPLHWINLQRSLPDNR